MICNPLKGPMLFDIYVPALKLAFEYHGTQHYYSHNVFGDAGTQKKRDDEKRKASELLEITLIEVPFWWQRDKESIIVALHNARPDLVHSAPQVTPFSYEARR